MLEPRRLRLLRELANRGTIAATAQACGYTPSGVSQQLALLEREVRMPLLVREGRRVALTEAARVLVDHAERVLAELEAAEAALAGLAGSVRGTARLAAFPTAAAAFVPAAIARCRTEHPDLRVILSELETDEAVAAVRSGRIDLALVYEYALLPRVADPGVDVGPLFTEPLLAALPRGRDAPEQVPLTILRDDAWIAPHSDTALRAVLDRACGLAGFAPDIDYVSDDYTVIVALVAAGLGVALLPRLATEALSAEVQLRPVVDPALTRTVSLVTRAGGRAHPTVAALARCLREAARDHGS
ncbi:DNA-binding transcriptional LysR family regulator [Pseudonocardia hierapolitana]|uniref:DNA-binding transcriptional LysR family regulator n=1 Tax=Pseudonocardia hierapolitana TaxID=1128676 RepID=A0A561SXU1_9PSEU|nr:LysR family transcriptional regulator [Pseudonocardia hierapolitana]TWF79688.1 DNA-binding transcriptional LysR family regulator [Pseudonocardia hierapolitana]